MNALFKSINGKHIRFLTGILWRSGRKLHLLNMGVILVQSIVPLTIAYQIKLIFDELITRDLPNHNILFSNVFWHLAGILCMALIGVWANSTGSLIKRKLNQYIMDSVLHELYTKSITLELAQFEDSGNFDIFYRAQTDAPGRLVSMCNQIQSLLQSVIMLLGLLGMFLILHWVVGIILFVSLLPGLVVRYLFSQKNYIWQQQKTSERRRGDYFAWLITAYSVVKEIRLFDLGHMLKNKEKEIRDKLFTENFNIIRKAVLWDGLTKSLEAVCIYGLFLYLVTRANLGLISFGDLILYYQLLTRGQGAIGSLFTSITGMIEDSVFLNNLVQFLNLKPLMIDPPQPASMPKQVKSLTIRDVSFQYPSQSRFSLRNISMTAKQGDKIAIVGKNGSGKTTLLRLLCRLQDPSSGTISLNGTDYRRFLLRDLQRKISAHFQDYVNFQFTAKEAITLGDVTSNSEHKFIEAAILSGADNFINQLPKKYDSVLGKMFDNGCEISTGQWQKVALSRALFRNASIVILDEPFSAMDAEAERTAFEKVCTLTANNILFLVSHRLSTIKTATRIYYLENGEIVEAGTHEELMEKQGGYATLFNIQHTSLESLISHH